MAQPGFASCTATVGAAEAEAHFSVLGVVGPFECLASIALQELHPSFNSRLGQYLGWPRHAGADPVKVPAGLN